jgi:hypothetical protein
LLSGRDLLLGAKHLFVAARTVALAVIRGLAYASRYGIKAGGNSNRDDSGRGILAAGTRPSDAGLTRKVRL